ncbi:glucose-1-phosphate cytidylyltransferase [Leptospira gomenensis]|uniref:Glucose-1-phosphate cytidylyltransferase n=1 Tax=Leptospira gomenensis TaxID=2484974 RepID=A0A5F1YRG8_9LEPT|nr:glucose-1-phosphate cytidylyltransferase [Leptospira gomenensis]TGK30914.1 glucose-1-phosphate cytidylyltransferase [Leptospira gomenensis]TGK32552.1 glucose-1-phosphate cytidylyltransferase [Leptospira gomenensis]TGK45366.1 glucose-1-phosphate cytidylyltransferase [Leptospira gomenensis]TGK60642.1 glucose-1-phosphate cytidylyltransferase [Leptospira gomenensis]
MKVVILAGGFGSRLSEYTNLVPKPLVEIGEYPILWHIMNTFAFAGHKDFYIALGYKAELIKEYFLKYYTLNSDFTIDLANNDISYHSRNVLDWKVTLVDTGMNSMTGGRLKRLKEFLGEETFLLTYGDGVANVDVNQLIAFHKQQKKKVTVTAVRPVARFGELQIDEKKIVTNFSEKPQANQGYINGGFFVMEPSFINWIENDSTVLEKEPLEKAAEEGELTAYIHDGFWQCMDTLRDKNYLEDLWRSGKAPWKIW